MYDFLEITHHSKITDRKIPNQWINVNQLAHLNDKCDFLEITHHKKIIDSKYTTNKWMTCYAIYTFKSQVRLSRNYTLLHKDNW